MRSTSLVLGVVAAALTLSACSGTPGASPLEEALSSEEIGDEGTVAALFIDVRGIRETVGRDPIDLTGPVDQSSWDEADRWANGIVLDRMHPGPDGGPAVPMTDVEWTYAGLRGWAAKAPQETIDATLEHWASRDVEGYVQVVDQTMVMETGSGAEWATEFEESMLDAPAAQAILPCVAEAHVVGIVGSDEPSGFYKHSFATAASVDDEARGRAWSCVHVPGGADEFAAGVEGDHIGEVTVDGDVVRVEILVESSGEAPLPAAARHAFSGLSNMSPGF